MVPASTVVAGDEITEVDTLDGPWYRVRRIDGSAGRVLLDDGDGVGIEVDVAIWSSVVLRR